MRDGKKKDRFIHPGYGDPFDQSIYSNGVG